jgi:hypothetical protein
MSFGRGDGATRHVKECAQVRHSFSNLCRFSVDHYHLNSCFIAPEGHLPLLSPMRKLSEDE